MPSAGVPVRGGPALKCATRVLFWDIDGTLLVTGRAGMIAWERAFAEETGGRPFPTVRPDGLTDHQIAAWLLTGTAAVESEGDPDVQAAAARLVARYEAELTDALPLRQGRVLDHVREILEAGRDGQPGRLTWLVTGNTHVGAAAKLRHYALSGFFEGAGPGGSPALCGAFSTRVEPRAHIARRALEMAQAAVPDLAPGEVLIVGDTPHDIEGAHAIGVPALAVATNTHSLDELRAHHPWRALPQLPPSAEFEALLLEGA